MLEIQLYDNDNDIEYIYYHSKKGFGYDKYDSYTILAGEFLRDYYEESNEFKSIITHAVITGNEIKHKIDSDNYKYCIINTVQQ